ncbi:MAG: hypothetical protein EBU90_28670, partial [Proteobacteria bacterium]|nr:hypothetical protein [Pseudomonadota bacterium]
MADSIASASLSLDPEHLQQLSDLAGQLMPEAPAQEADANQDTAPQPSASEAPVATSSQGAVPQAPGQGEGGLDPALVEALKGMKDIQPGETAQPGMNPALMPETPKADPNAQVKKKGNVVDEFLGGAAMG